MDTNITPRDIPEAFKKPKPFHMSKKLAMSVIGIILAVSVIAAVVIGARYVYIRIHGPVVWTECYKTELPSQYVLDRGSVQLTQLKDSPLPGCFIKATKGEATLTTSLGSLGVNADTLASAAKQQAQGLGNAVTIQTAYAATFAGKPAYIINATRNGKPVLYMQVFNEQFVYSVGGPQRTALYHGVTVIIDQDSRGGDTLKTLEKHWQWPAAEAE